MPDEASKPDGVWDEFDWERFLQQQDRKTERYLKLLEQYLDHPERDQIIAREMGWSHLLDDSGQDWAANLEQLFSADDEEVIEFFDESEDEDDDEEDFEDDEDDLEEFEDDDVDFDEEEDEEDEFDEEEEEDAEAFESHPVYLSAMALTAWIDQAIQDNDGLAHDSNMVRMATHSAITASKIAAALTDGGNDELGMTIAYLKRGLFAINTALDSFMQIQESPQLAREEQERIRTGIFETRNGIVDLIGQCRAEWRARYGRQ